MFIEIKSVMNTYSRPSKTGKLHTYYRAKTIGIFCCDNCDCVFERELGNMDKKRLSNRYFHVCPNCDAKKFAQKKGAEKRKFWSLSADSNIDISKN
jgi:hypothetical protein